MNKFDILGVLSDRRVRSRFSRSLRGHSCRSRLRIVIAARWGSVIPRRAYTYLGVGKLPLIERLVVVRLFEIITSDC